MPSTTSECFWAFVSSAHIGASFLEYTVKHPIWTLYIYLGRGIATSATAVCCASQQVQSIAICAGVHF